MDNESRTIRRWRFLLTDEYELSHYAQDPRIDDDLVLIGTEEEARILRDAVCEDWEAEHGPLCIRLTYESV